MSGRIEHPQDATSRCFLLRRLQPIKFNQLRPNVNFAAQGVSLRKQLLKLDVLVQKFRRLIKISVGVGAVNYPQRIIAPHIAEKLRANVRIKIGATAKMYSALKNMPCVAKLKKFFNGFLNSRACNKNIVVKKISQHICAKSDVRINIQAPNPTIGGQKN